MAAELSYTLSVLLDTSRASFTQAEAAIHYGDLQTAPVWAKIVILPSGFFNDGIYNTGQSLPRLPLQKIEGVPLLFGQPDISWRPGRDGVRRLFIKADIIASAYFLLTRYEEIVRRKVRDQHGRFPGNESLPYRAGFLRRPIVEEYGALLRKWLRDTGVELPMQGKKSRIVLTHDVDSPYISSSVKSLLFNTTQYLLNEPKKFFIPIGSLIGICQDPYDNFSWISHQDNSLKLALGTKQVESIYFMMASKLGYKDGFYRIDSPRIKRLMKYLAETGAKIGLHSSYAAGIEPKQIVWEKIALERAFGKKVTANRHHFLCWREPEHVSALEQAGITDDYTLCYADQPGFRLGVCHPVRYFDPVARRLTKINVHPLTVMDCTLEAKRYLNLPCREAKRVCYELIKKIKQHDGEFVILWHNTEFSKPYHQALYKYILKTFAV